MVPKIMSLIFQDVIGDAMTTADPQSLVEEEEGIISVANGGYSCTNSTLLEVSQNTAATAQDCLLIYNEGDDRLKLDHRCSQSHRIVTTSFVDSSLTAMDLGKGYFPPKKFLKTTKKRPNSASIS